MNEGEQIMTGISALVNEDILQNILYRLPAKSFASAACVSKSWNKVCNRILSRPKLASALTLSHHVEVAVTEVLNEVLSKPIRPHFAIAFVGLQFNLAAAHQIITRTLGSKTPVITNASAGIIGVDARTNELNEINFHGDDIERCGIVLVVGFLPGLKVETIPLLRPKRGSNAAMVDKFMTDIRHYTTSVSGCPSPDAIMLFGDQYFDLKPILTEMDYGLPEETVIVGDARSCFLFKTGNNSQNYNGNLFFFDSIALVFARDKDESNVTGKIQFNAAVSNGILPFGPKLRAVSVRMHNANCSLFTARMEGHHQILVDSLGLMEDIKEMADDDYPCLFIGVMQRKESSIGSSQNLRSKSYLTLYEVLGGENEYFAIRGIGIKPGDSFIFYHSDSDTASCSCDDVCEDLRIFKESTTASSSPNPHNINGDNKKVFGGLIFSCLARRSGVLFGLDDDYVESFPFCENFPGIPLAGVFGSGEIGRGGKFPSINQRGEEDGVFIQGRCLLHHCSTVYLVMSYTPPPPTSEA